MRHGQFGGYFFNNNMILFIGLVILIIFIIIIITKLVNKKKNEEEISENQKDSIGNFSSLVTSMLSQHGSGLKQYEISSNLGLPTKIVAEKLLEMEKEGLITRKWENNEYTYIINKLE